MVGESGETVTISVDMDGSPSGGKGGADRKDDPIDDMDRASLFTGWIMLGIAIALFVLSFSIAMWGLDTVFSNKRFPADTDTPCFLAFMVMGTIFLVLGIVYRDMAVHPEIFENVREEKSEYMKKREEWERIKQRVKEMESEKAKVKEESSGTGIGTGTVASRREECDD